jgi:hypothetical protein
MACGANKFSGAALRTLVIEDYFYQSLLFTQVSKVAS